MPLKIFPLYLILSFFWTALAKADQTAYSDALKYFTDKPPTKKENISAPGQSLLAFSIGNLINNKIYGQFNHRHPLWSSEIFYQFHSGSYVARAFHLEWQQFPGIPEKLDKLGFLFSLSFPRPISFPVYLGVAAGPGIFIKSKDKNPDWIAESRAYLGFRLTGNKIQYFLQTGFKNHLLKFKKSIFPGWFISMGLAYRL